MAHVAKTATVTLAPARAVRLPLLTAAIVVAVGMLLVALCLPALLGQVYVADDLGAFHVPARAFYADALTHGERFDWWPQLFGGFYLTGEGQVGSYHPLHLVLYRCLPLQTALSLELILSYPWMLLGSYCWLRRRVGRRDAALFGAMLITFCSFNLLHLPHLNAVAVVAHIPWLLWAIDVLVCDRRRKERTIAAAAIPLLTASQLLLGYPQYVWYSMLLESGYTWWLLRTQRTTMPANTAAGAATPATECSPDANRLTASKVWLTLGGGLALGALIGAIQLLPTLDALSHSVRQASPRTFADYGSLHPWNLVQLVGPYLLQTRVVGLNTHELGLYAGCVPLVLCAWLWIRRRELGAMHALVVGAAWLAVLSLWLAAGQYGYLNYVQTWLPVVGKFRFPCRIIVLFQLAMGVLSAAALALLVTRQPSRSRLECRDFGPLWALVVASVIAAAVASLIWRPYVAAWPLVCAGPLLIGLAAWLVWLADSYRRWALVALVLLAAADLGAYGLSFSVYGKTAALTEFASSTPAPPQGNQFRMKADANHSGLGNRATLAGWSLIDGYAGLEPAKQLTYYEPAQRIAGVKWSRAVDSLTPYCAMLFEVENPMPPQWLVAQTQVSRDPARDIESINPTTTALVEPEFISLGAMPADTARNSNPPQAGTVIVIDQGPGRATLTTNCPAPNLLLLSQSWHEGWRATVNGRPAKVWRVDGDFIGCVVPPGESRVNLEFRPASLRNGAWLSAAGLGLWTLSVCVMGLIWGRPRRPLSSKESCG